MTVAERLSDWQRRHGGLPRERRFQFILRPLTALCAPYVHGLLRPPLADSAGPVLPA